MASRGNSSCQGTPWVSGWATASATTSSQASNSSSPLGRTSIPGGVTRSVLAVQRTAEHVLERLEPVAPLGQQGADRGVGEVGELDLHGGAAGGEGPLDLVEGGRARHAAEAEPRDLVERRARLGEARDAAGDGDHETRRVGPAAAGGLAGLGDELRLDPLDALGQGGVAEQRQPAGVHAQSLARIFRKVAVDVRSYSKTSHLRQQATPHRMVTGDPFPA